MNIEKLARKPKYSKYLRDVMVNISKLTLTYKQQDKQICNVQLISLNKEENKIICIHSITASYVSI